jgi:polysaccharide export outer membrane protein
MKPGRQDEPIWYSNAKKYAEGGKATVLQIDGAQGGCVGRTMRWEAILILVFASVTLIGKAADTFTPTYTANPATPEYRLGPEDVIEVFVWKQPELTTTVVIRPDGRISLPLTNELEASGKTAVQLQKEITERLQEYITKPIVNVIVKQVNSLKISVLGEVRKPDVYRIKNQVTVLDAIAMAGGFTDLARPNRVIVIRNARYGPQRIKINVKQVVADDSKGPFYLQPLDTVYVE